MTTVRTSRSLLACHHSATICQELYFQCHSWAATRARQTGGGVPRILDKTQLMGYYVPHQRDLQFRYLARVSRSFYTQAPISSLLRLRFQAYSLEKCKEGGKLFTALAIRRSPTSIPSSPAEPTCSEHRFPTESNPGAAATDLYIDFTNAPSMPAFRCDELSSDGHSETHLNSSKEV